MDTIGLAQVLVETSGSSVVVYAYGLGRLAQVEDGDWEWFLADALGSVRQMVDDDGAVILARDYSPFGLLRAEAGTGDSGYGFTGEQGGLGLVYLRARWYDPSLGRFLSVDPYLGGARLPQTQHPYVYCLNNPVLFVDPSGLQGGPAFTPGYGGGSGPEDTSVPVFYHPTPSTPEAGSTRAPTGYIPSPGVTPATPTPAMQTWAPSPAPIRVPDGIPPPPARQPSVGLLRGLGWSAFPLPDGFFVGRSLNITFGWMGANVWRRLYPCPIEGAEQMNVISWAEETVYDFVHREKQVFHVATYGMVLGATLFGGILVRLNAQENGRFRPSVCRRMFR
jgi:RHS repeat-associated protein